MKMISLRQCVVDPASVYPSSHILSHSSTGPIDWGEFCQRIAAWEQVFSEFSEARVALYQRDGVEFLATLIALWRCGKQALLPANNLPATCLGIREHTRWFAGDFPIADGLRKRGSISASARFAPVPLLPADATALILFTSGSSGAPEAVPKSFAQLEGEVHTLESFRGETLGDTVITGTVSHQHIYGLLFRLLWPLMSGRRFIDQERDYWEQIAEDACNFPSIALITSPAHLNRIPPEFSIGQPAAVFSSGAPLATEPAKAAAQQLGRPVTEVYGSTETGGIAWREQTASSRWKCLPGASISIDEEAGLLAVKSPHLPDREWFITADRAEQGEGDFALLGRADRIAKVGGKRISLTLIESLLGQYPMIREARVTVLQDKQDRLGAVVILSEDGEKFLQDHGKKALNAYLKGGLKDALEPIAIPRYWRYPVELPLNSQGKVTQLALAALFEPVAARLPRKLGVEERGQALRLKLQVPENLLYFDGHFPANPVLPGVVQIHWAVHYAREHWADLGEFGGLEAMKFQQLILPHQNLVLDLEYLAEKGKLYFCYSSDAGPDSSGHSEAEQHSADSSPTGAKAPISFSSGRILLISET